MLSREEANLYIYRAREGILRVLFIPGEGKISFVNPWTVEELGLEKYEVDADFAEEFINEQFMALEYRWN